MQPPVTSTHLRAYQWLPERATSLLGRAIRMVFRAGRLGLRLEHLVFRCRKPRHRQLCRILVLLLDPVQYELLPRLRWGKPKGLQQRTARFLVMRFCSPVARDASLTARTVLGISDADDERLWQKLQDSQFDLASDYSGDFTPSTIPQSSIGDPSGPPPSRASACAPNAPGRSCETQPASPRRNADSAASSSSQGSSASSAD